jgi:hypothetical protein
MQARHASLRVAGKYLHTSVVEGEPVFDASVVLFPEAPVPIARGPRKTASTDAPPLFFVRLLLPTRKRSSPR